MRLFVDNKNAQGIYCYHTFESSYSGESFFFEKQNVAYLVIPVVNLGVYGLDVINEDPSITTFIDKAYYVFRDVISFEEKLILRKEHDLYGVFNNRYEIFDYKNLKKEGFYIHSIEQEEGITKLYAYGGMWKVESKSLCIAIPDSSLISEDENFFLSKPNMSDDLRNFLFNKNIEVLIEEIGN